MAGLRLVLVDEFGNTRSLGENISVGPEQPTNPDVLLWIDTTTTPPTFKTLNGDIYESVENVECVQTTTTTDIPFTRLVEVNLNHDDIFSLAGGAGIGGIRTGRECHIIVHNTGSNNITITLPNGSGYVLISDDSALVVSAGGYAEINVISTSTTDYIRAI